jgi:hypothetical protein
VIPLDYFRAFRDRINVGSGGTTGRCLGLVESSPQVLDYEAVQRGKALSLTKDLSLHVKDSHGQNQKRKRKWEVILIG